MATVRRYGWRRDLPSQIPWFDHERLLRAAGAPPAQFDGRPFVKWVYDQGQEGSCTANSGVSSERYFRATHGLADFLGSRQFLYYVTRASEGTAGSDSGATIADTVAAEAKWGVCPEPSWPYAKKLTAKPTAAAYAEAKKHLVLAKAPVQQLQQAMEAVLAAGQPIHYGMTVYESFESDAVARSGIVPMPRRSEQALGGHALVLVGYLRAKKVFIGLNSWGPTWGQGGLGVFQIPYAYLLNPDLASDFWTVSGVS
jgi:C1A family cysteine protease